MYACDFSSTAVEIVKQHPEYNKHDSNKDKEHSGRCNAFVCDITRPDVWESNAPFEENSLGSVCFDIVRPQFSKMSYYKKK